MKEIMREFDEKFPTVSGLRDAINDERILFKQFLEQKLQEQEEKLRLKEED